ncbi:hypothetical protein [Planococcus koreensis]
MLRLESGSLGKGTVSSMASLLRLLLAKEEYIVFTNELERLMADLKVELPRRAYGEIMRDTGFREN